MEELIKIEITTPEAILFRSFMEFNNTFALLIKAGVFDVKNGSATIHFGPNGEVTSIIRNDSIFNIHAK